MIDEGIIEKEKIKELIHSIRGLQVMIDNDLAKLYEIQTKALNQAVKRNKERFPKEFMFQLTISEYNSLRSQSVTLEKNPDLRFQFGTSNTSRGKHKKYLPYAFTEQGVAMLSAVLRSKVAIRVSVQIINAFVQMRKIIAFNANVFLRLEKIEQKQLITDSKMEQVFKLIEDRDIKPRKGIFYNGQVFDAHKFISGLIRSADKSIILIDNYIDESVLHLFTKRKKGIFVKILTKNTTEQLKLDLKKFNSQYEKIDILQFNKSHDRFLIIDDKEIYHIGASLKDLGKKWFAFSKFDKGVLQFLNKLPN